MEIFSVENLTFKYPKREKPALQNISFSAQRGEFIVLCGTSGSGKTTLMRMLKEELAPYGEKTGEIKINGEIQGTGKDKVGFVLQNPENQIVTDKVWHELAFGPENLGWDNETIRIRVAEMAAYFGIQNWFRKDVNQLSGGQKQILNLAAVMVMKPEILILDEPTSQLDPVAAGEFIDTVKKLNRETGVTVLMTEHRLENVLPLADRVLVMDKGSLIINDIPANAAALLAERKHPMFKSMPAPVQTYGMVFEEGLAEGYTCPIDVQQGRKWLEKCFEKKNLLMKKLVEKELGREKKNTTISAVELKNIWFRYEKSGEDILRGLTCKINKGECFAFVGGNGSGKTTMLKIILGAVKPYRGKKKSGEGKILMLPQNPQDVFAKDTVREELLEMVKGKNENGDRNNAIEKVGKSMNVLSLFDSHPYDISGGEQQRVAIAKLLLANPDIILMDEPTKGMDNDFKEELAKIMKKLKEQGKTIILVSHDIEFCGKYADRCSMVFDGDITTTDAPKKFFSGNNFYTTAANKMSSEFFEEAITAKELGKLMCINLKAGRA